MRGGDNGEGADCGVAVWMYAVCVTLPNVAAVMSLLGYHHLDQLKTLKQSRRTIRLVGPTILKLLYKPTSTLCAPSAR